MGASERRELSSVEDHSACKQRTGTDALCGCRICDCSIDGPRRSTVASFEGTRRSSRLELPQIDAPLGSRFCSLGDLLAEVVARCESKNILHHRQNR